MLVELNENLYKRILEIGESEYKRPIQADNKVYVDVDDIYTMLQDLVDEYDHKKEEYDKLKSDVDNYYEMKKEDLYEDYGVSRNDF